MVLFLRTLLAVSLLAHPLVDCVWEHEHSVGAVQTSLCPAANHSADGHQHAPAPHCPAQACALHEHDSVVEPTAGVSQPIACDHAFCGLHCTTFLTSAKLVPPDWNGSAWTALPADAALLHASNLGVAQLQSSLCNTGPPPLPLRLHLLFGTLLI